MRLQRALPLMSMVLLLPTVLCGQSTLDLSGKVVDCSNSRPIPDASIQLDAVPYAIITDADGRFHIYGLKAGTYTAAVEAPAYYRKSNQQLIVNDDFTEEYTICLEPRLYHAEPQRIEVAYDPDRHGTVTLRHGSPEFESSGSLGELVETIPELLVSYSGGKSGEATVSVRGGPSKEVLVLVDGVSINSPLTGVADVNSIPLANVSRVEFNSGGASSQFGAGAVGGVLNVITTAASDASQYNIAGSTGALDARSWESNARLHIGKVGSVSGLYSGSTAANDFMFDSDKDGIIRRENADLKRTNVSLTGERRLGMGAKFGLAYHRFEQKNGLPGFIYQLNPVARKDETRDILSLLFDAEDGTGFYSAGYSYRHNDQVFRDTFEFTSVKYHAGYLDRLHQLNLKGGLRLPHDMRAEFSTTAGQEEFSTENFLDPGKPAFAPVVEKRAAFALSTSKGWMCSTESFRYNGDILFRLRGDYSSLFLPVYSPSIHLGSSFTRWLELRGELSYGKSYRVPLYSSLFWNDGVNAIGNPDLQPERMEESSASVSVSFPVLGDLVMEALYQHSAYKNLIYWDRTFDNKFSPRNLSGSLIYARTLNVFWTLRPLRLTITYSNTDQIAKDRSWRYPVHDHQLVFRPRYIQHLSIRHASKYLDLHYRLRNISRRYMRAENTKWLDGYKVADFSVALKYDFGWLKARIQYDLDNMTDTEYMLLERFPCPGQLWGVSVKLTFPLGIE
jgi:outer membrane cobalamin receptor